jgi:hypothetical protein
MPRNRSDSFQWAVGDLVKWVEGRVYRGQVVKVQGVRDQPGHKVFIDWSLTESLHLSSEPSQYSQSDARLYGDTHHHETFRSTQNFFEKID